jgi:hypothetical protein
VIVDAPRDRPRRASSPAEAIASGSNPVFVQKVLSSTAVVASIRIPGIWSKVTASRRMSPNLASSTLPVRS